MLKKVETVLIGTSLTEPSDQVVRAGLKVARAANARVVLAHAYPSQMAYAGAPYVPELPEVVEAQKESLRRKMEGQAHVLGILTEADFVRFFILTAQRPALRQAGMAS
jgi:nucleotide-binding universal stress UspA family protein